MDINTCHIQVGQVVHHHLFDGRHGVVYKIYGTQNPNTCQAIGTYVYIGGSATFDIVFDNGDLTYRVREAELRGSQWTIKQDIYPETTIEKMLDKAHHIREKQKLHEYEDKQKRHNQIEVLKQQNRYLTPMTNTDYGSEIAAKNLRVELKRAYPGVKFSVRRDRRGNTALLITWTDGPTIRGVKDIAGKYLPNKLGYKENSSSYNVDSLWRKVFGYVKHIEYVREHSDELIEEVINTLADNYKRKMRRAGIDKPTVNEFRNGRLENVRVPTIHRKPNDSLGRDIQRLIQNHSTAA